MSSEEVNYSERFFSKEEYKRRVTEELFAGKTVMIATICPECWLQVRTASLRDFDSSVYVFCTCSRDEIECVDETTIVRILAPEEWDTEAVIVDVGAPKW